MLRDVIEKARDMTWTRFGKELTVYLPGMFRYDGKTGKYPAISITGNACELQCDHCRATTLQTMIHAESSEALWNKAIRLDKNGNHGILLSGGSNRNGSLPWKNFIPAIQRIKENTDLFISIHCGILDDQTAMLLYEAGVDQALIDVIGDDETFKRVYHVDFGISKISDTIESLKRTGIQIIPHVVCGLHYGEIKSEKKALRIISEFDVEQVVIVSLMPIPGTPVEDLNTPEAEEIAEIIAEARLIMPDKKISLGCARKRGDVLMEILAIDAGVNRMALPSGEALLHAESRGLKIRYQSTCCSVSKDFTHDGWV